VAQPGSILSDGQSITRDEIAARLDHIDEQLHALVRVLAEYKPLLDYARARVDPGKGMRQWLKGSSAKPNAAS
jgi:hypothetical protein